MASKEYDSFKTEKGEVVDLQQAVDKDGAWNGIYDRNNIFCPECGRAKLKFTSRTNSHCEYLSSKPIPPNPPHMRCSHQYKAISKSGARLYYDTCTREQAMDKINACINMMKRRGEPNPGGSGVNPPFGDDLVVKHTQNGHTESRRLRTRSFYSVYKIDEEDLGFPIVFYGKVFLKFQKEHIKDKNISFNTIKVYSSYNDRRQLQSLYFGKNTIDIKDDQLYLFSMIGVPKREGKYINVTFYGRDYSLFSIEEAD